MQTRSCVAALLCLCAAVPVRGQGLPDARQLADRFVTAVGGADAVRASFASRTMGRVSFPQTGAEGVLEVTVSPPRQLAHLTIPGFGDVFNGTDGHVAWSMDPAAGARLASGAELRDALAGVDVRTALWDPSAIRAMAPTKDTVWGSERCWLVHTSWSDGRETDHCFSASSGLVVGIRREQTRPSGALSVTSTLSGYRDVAGVKRPTHVVQEVGGQQQVITIDTATPPPAGDDWYRVPAPVQALLAGGAHPE